MTHTLQDFAASSDGPPDLARFTPEVGGLVIVESSLGHKPGLVLEQLPLAEARRLWAGLVASGWVAFKPPVVRSPARKVAAA